MVWTSPRTWVALETPTAATMNTHVRDNFKAIGDAWTAYTPLWTAATTNPVIGNGSIIGRYSAAGKRVAFWVVITMGSTTTYGSGVWQVSLPVLQVSTPNWIFQGRARDDSATASYPAFAENHTGSVVRMQRLPTTAGGAWSSVTATSPFTWATGDQLSFNGTYEAA